MKRERHEYLDICTSIKNVVDNMIITCQDYMLK